MIDDEVSETSGIPSYSVTKYCKHGMVIYTGFLLRQPSVCLYSVAVVWA